MTVVGNDQLAAPDATKIAAPAIAAAVARRAETKLTRACDQGVLGEDQDPKTSNNRARTPTGVASRRINADGDQPAGEPESASQARGFNRRVNQSVADHTPRQAQQGQATSTIRFAGWRARQFGPVLSAWLISWLTEHQGEGR